MSYRNYSTANSHIVDPSGNGDFTSIAAALTAAVSGQTIFIRPGTYTENLTLKAGLSINAYGGDALTPTVLIVGNHTYTGIGACTFSNIQFQTNSGYIGTVSGSSASVLTFTNCWFNITNNNGFLLSSSSANSQINLFNCFGDVTTTGITIADVTGAGTFSARNTRITNSGNSTTASTSSSSTTGLIAASNCTFGTPFVSSGNGSLEFFYCRLAMLNTTAITTSGTSSICQLYWCTLISGTASAVSIGSGTAAEVDHCIISSSNTNAITGAGILIYGAVTFDGSSSGVNTSTLTPLTTLPSAGGGNSATAFLYILASSDMNVLGGGVTDYYLGSGTALTKIFDTTGTMLSGANLTIPTTGYWTFNYAVTLFGVAAAHDFALLPVNTTTSRSYQNTYMSGADATTAGYLGVNTTITAFTTAGDVWKFDSYIGSAPSQTISVLGEGTNYTTYISGHFIGT